MKRKQINLPRLTTRDKHMADNTARGVSRLGKIWTLDKRKDGRAELTQTCFEVYSTLKLKYLFAVVDTDVKIKVRVFQRDTRKYRHQIPF